MTLKINEMLKELLNGLSSDSLRALASFANNLAGEKEGGQPTYQLALLNGIKECGYSTASWGWVRAYSGTATIVMSDGSKWVATGHGPQGSASRLSRNGFIEFVKVD